MFETIVDALPWVGATAGLLVLEWIVCRRRFRSTDKGLREAVSLLKSGERIDLSVSLPTKGQATETARALNDLTFALNGIMIEVAAASRKFSLFSSDIYYSGRHLSELSDRQVGLMDAVLELADGFQQKLNGVAEMASDVLDRLGELDTRSEELERETDRANDELLPLQEAAGEAGVMATHGLTLMEHSYESTERLRHEIVELHAKIERMRERTGLIGTVLSAIHDIAEKTHVLATNTSIEAARAGEAGRGFAVIASEIRSLAKASRDALAQVDEILTSTAKDIQESAAVSTQGEALAQELSRDAAEARSGLERIAQHVGSVSGGMDGFREVFDAQRNAVRLALETTAAMRATVADMGEEIRRHAEGYTGFRSQVGDAAEGARSAAHSARVLSQLGTYLRTGGQELSHVIGPVTASEARMMAGHTRKEPRTTLLYNLEVMREGEQLGHLGDISPSGLMLYATDPLPLGQSVDALIKLPLSFGDVPDVPIRFVPRRNTKFAWFYKIGCSIDPHSSRSQKADIEMIIANYTVTHGMELPVGPGGTEPGGGGADTAGRPAVGGQASLGGAQASARGQTPVEELGDLDAADVEELEEV